MDNQKKLFEELLKADGINPTGPTDSERSAFREMLDQHISSKQSKSNLRIGLQKLISQYRITKYAAAAIILIIALFGINRIGIPVDMAGVVLADVAEKMKQVTNAVFEKTLTISSSGQTMNTIHSLVYYAEEGIREDTIYDEKVIKQVYLNLKNKNVFGVDHMYRIYGQLNLTADDQEKLAPINPKHVVERLLSKGSYKKLGKKTVDGISAVGFEFKDKRAFLSMDQDKIGDEMMTRIWVDIETKMPVRFEFDGTVNDSQINIIVNNPSWDIDLEDNFFEPHVPDGYLHSEERGLVGIDLTDWPVLKVIPGMAADKAGVKHGDIALQIDGQDISHVESKEDALDLFFGKAGETVVLTVERDGQIVTVEIIRDSLPE